MILSLVFNHAHAAYPCHISPGSTNYNNGFGWVMCRLLSTIAIRSLADESVCQSIDTEIAGLGVDAFTSKETKWFLHWLRSELTGAFAAVQVSRQDDPSSDHMSQEYASLL